MALLTSVFKVLLLLSAISKCFVSILCKRVNLALFILAHHTTFSVRKNDEKWGREEVICLHIGAEDWQWDIRNLMAQFIIKGFLYLEYGFDFASFNYSFVPNTFVQLVRQLMFWKCFVLNLMSFFSLNYHRSNDNILFII